MRDYDVTFVCYNVSPVKTCRWDLDLIRVFEHVLLLTLKIYLAGIEVQSWLDIRCFTIICKKKKKRQKKIVLLIYC